MAAAVLWGPHDAQGSPHAAGDASALPTIGGEVVDRTIRVPTESNALAVVGGRARVVSNAGAFLVARTRDMAFVALAATCSHEACAISEIDDNAYVCPCHGSRFDVEGRVLTGPAEVPLYELVTTWSGGVLIISL